MAFRTSQTGVGHLVALLAVVVLAVTGFAGYSVWKAGQDKPVAEQSTQADTAADDTAIKTKADLQSANTLLDNTATQLDKDLDTSVLDSDIDQLL